MFDFKTAQTLAASDTDAINTAKKVAELLSGIEKADYFADYAYEDPWYLAVTRDDFGDISGAKAYKNLNTLSDDLVTRYAPRIEAAEIGSVSAYCVIADTVLRIYHAELEA